MKKKSTHPRQNGNSSEGNDNAVNNVTSSSSNTSEQADESTYSTGNEQQNQNQNQRNRSSGQVFNVSTSTSSSEIPDYDLEDGATIEQLESADPYEEPQEQCLGSATHVSCSGEELMHPFCEIETATTHHMCQYSMFSKFLYPFGQQALETD